MAGVSRTERARAALCRKRHRPVDCRRAEEQDLASYVAIPKYPPLKRMYQRQSHPKPKGNIAACFKGVSFESEPGHRNSYVVTLRSADGVARRAWRHRTGRHDHEPHACTIIPTLTCAPGSACGVAARSTCTRQSRNGVMP